MGIFCARLWRAPRRGFVPLRHANEFGSFLLQRFGRLEFGAPGRGRLHHRPAQKPVPRLLRGICGTPTYNPGESTRHIDWKFYGRSTNSLSSATRKRPTCGANSCSTAAGPCGTCPSETRRSRAEQAQICHPQLAALIELFRRQATPSALVFLLDELESHIPAKSSGAHSE